MGRILYGMVGVAQSGRGRGGVSLGDLQQVGHAGAYEVLQDDDFDDSVAS